MSLYDLKQEDIDDLRALISAASLTITANNAARVTQLQSLLRNAVPSRALEESEARRETLEHEVQECLRARDASLLDAGLAKRRADDAERMLADANDARDGRKHATQA